MPAAWLSGGARARASRLLEITAVLARRQWRAEWAGSPPHRWLLSRPRPRGLAAAPRDPRPGRPAWGQALLAGRFAFDGLMLDVGPGGDPWNRPAPSRAFARALHGMDWLPDLLSAPGGARAGLSLALGWQAVFGRWNGFSWSPQVLERRVFNLACSARALAAEASPSETASLLDSLARQARCLLQADEPEARAAERAAAAATAGCALAGAAGEQLAARALPELERRLPETAPADGSHATRSPEAGLELLLDLMALDGALDQLGQPALPELARAIDRLAGALPFFVLGDGRLMALQGSEESDPERIKAALAGREAPSPLPPACGGYHRIASRTLELAVDAAAPARGAWSLAACAQPLAIEVLAGGARLVTSSAWSPRAEGTQALRLTPAASTLNVSDSSYAAPVGGRLAQVLGHRLEGPQPHVTAQRRDSDEAVWLELSHDGWGQSQGLLCVRRLYLDRAADELRGEDALSPLPGAAAAPGGRRPAILVVRFQLHPEVKASLALDRQSVLLRPKGGRGWWLRNDAQDVTVEPATHLEEGRPRQASQVVLKRPPGPDGGARIRWKLGMER